MIRNLFLFYRCIAIISIIILSAKSLFSQGSPPLLVDDTGTPGDGNWEINLVASLEHSDMVDEWEAPLFDINYGVGERLQLKVETPYLINKEENSKAEMGFEGLKFGVKYRFYGSDGEGTSISCYPQIFSNFNNNDELELFLPVECHIQFEEIGLTGEIGHGWIGNCSEIWETGIGFGYHYRDTEFLFEWHSGFGSILFELSEPMVNFGFVWDWMESSSLMFSIAKGIHNKKDETNLWSLGGVQFLL